ncbi:MAG: hypothetical protein LBO67_04025 [Spirochaetaceae bacterium]|nr:hypothetical protein [Spirochaetaceae bacterium]
MFAQNYQKIHAVDSPVYRAITALYIAHGMALPSTTGPWSEDELLLMLNRLDPEKLKADEHATYNFVSETLLKQSSSLDFSLHLNLEAYGHTNTEDFTLLSDYIREPNRINNLIDFDTEMRITDHLYGLFTFSLGNAIINKTEKKYPGGSDLVASNFFGKTAFSTNVPVVPPAELSDLNFNFPSRSFAVFGGKGWSVQAGRDKLSWGPGESGNFTVGDHIHYHNTVHASLYNKSVKYTFNVSGFPNPNEYYTKDFTEGWSNDHAVLINGIPGWPKLDGINLFIAHRLEWRTLYDKLNLVLTEAVMYQDDTGLVDLQYLLPFTFLHNQYRQENSNSLLSLEVDFAVMPFLNLYGQLALDEYALPGESVPGIDDTALGDGLGYMLGVKTALPIAGGMLTGSLEGALTTPYLYLRSASASANDKRRPLNYVVATRYISTNGNDLYYDESFLGYRWGNDAIVVNLNGGYEQYGKWAVKANYMLMFHGTLDQWTIWDHIHANRAPYNQTTPSTSHAEDSYTDPTAASRNATRIMNAFSLTGSWNIWRALAVYGQADIVNIVHPGNIKTNKAITDIQLTLGISYTF